MGYVFALAASQASIQSLYTSTGSERSVALRKSDGEREREIEGSGGREKREGEIETILV